MNAIDTPFVLARRIVSNGPKTADASRMTNTHIIYQAKIKCRIYIVNYPYIYIYIYI